MWKAKKDYRDFICKLLNKRSFEERSGSKNFCNAVAQSLGVSYIADFVDQDDGKTLFLLSQLGMLLSMSLSMSLTMGHSVFVGTLTANFFVVKSSDFLLYKLG